MSTSNLEFSDPRLEPALVETLIFLQENYHLNFSLAEGKNMLELALGLSNPSNQRWFLAISLFMRGQLLLVCSPLNKYYFQREHPNETLTLGGLVHQWTKSTAAARYRTRELAI